MNIIDTLEFGHVAIRCGENGKFADGGSSDRVYNSKQFGKNTCIASQKYS